MRPSLLGVGVLMLLGALPAHGLPPLQLYIDLTPPGEVLHLAPGRYGGPAVIARAITVDGAGAAVVDGQGTGTVLTVRADGAVVRGLRITHSGEAYDGVDAGLLVEARNTRIEDNTIDDTLFGIHLKQADGNVVRDNRIAPRPNDLSLRGDGIRLWYSHDNLIEGNTVVGARDLVFTNSSGNRIVGNTIRDGRMGMEFIYAPDNEVADNTIEGTTTGIVVLYSDELVLRGNRIRHVRQIPGTGLVFKDSSGVVVEDNEVLHCAVGLEANAPVFPENILYLRRNRFAYNDIGLYFYGEKGGHVFHDNRFEQNLLTVAVTAASTALGNDWRGNYWDEYAGFDRDGDGTGDRPYQAYLYADRLWIDRPMTRLFRASPALEVVDFLERLAPFSAPHLILSDPAPRMR